MGLLDHLGDVQLRGPRQRRAGRLLDDGERCTATLLGIQVRVHNGGDLRWRFGVEVHPAGAAPFRAACEMQPPDHALDALRLGMAVPVRHDGEEAVLGWRTSEASWVPVPRVTDGIDDERLRMALREVGPGAGPAVVHGWRPYLRLGLLEGDARHVLLEAEGAEARWVRVFVPEYAGHLLHAGTVLHADLRRGGARVDWLEALERHGPGVGVPAPPPAEGGGGLLARLEAGLAGYNERVAREAGVLPPKR